MFDLNRKVLFCSGRQQEMSYCKKKKKRNKGCMILCLNSCEIIGQVAWGSVTGGIKNC